MKAIVVSAFPGCGKTYAFEHQEELGWCIKDSDSSKYEKEPNWEKTYVSDIKNAIESGEYDFIFVSQHDGIRKELQDQGVPFATVSPPGHDGAVYSRFLLEKAAWFDRFKDRDNSHIKDFDKFMKVLEDNYNSWTSKENQSKYGCKFHITLYRGRYIKDCLGSIKDFWIKNNWFE